MENNIKECNVLGSGPSRVSYVPNELPSIGCNFPWTKVDWTIIFDPDPLVRLADNPALIDLDTQLIISKHALIHIKHHKLIDKIPHKIAATYKNISHPEYGFKRSSGHYAAQWMISMGYNRLNIYGCDNYFGDLYCTDNYSHTPNTAHYIDNTNLKVYSDEQLRNRGKEWHHAWKMLEKQHPNVEFNFVR
jgi:hypothetical protein